MGWSQILNKNTNYLLDLCFFLHLNIKLILFALINLDGFAITSCEHELIFKNILEELNNFIKYKEQIEYNYCKIFDIEINNNVVILIFKDIENNKEYYSLNEMLCFISVENSKEEQYKNEDTKNNGNSKTK